MCNVLRFSQQCKTKKNTALNDVLGRNNVPVPEKGVKKREG